MNTCAYCLVRIQRARVTVHLRPYESLLPASARLDATPYGSIRRSSPAVGSSSACRARQRIRGAPPSRRRSLARIVTPLSRWRSTVSIVRRDIGRFWRQGLKCGRPQPVSPSNPAPNAAEGASCAVEPACAAIGRVKTSFRHPKLATVAFESIEEIRPLGRPRNGAPQ
jgi:hypothetical protein